jgi:mono/diheme cytochrome c family protein
MKKKILYSLAAVAAVALVVVLAAWPRDRYVTATSAQAYASTPANIARGAYLARAGDCMACHTTRGGAAYAGGRALETPFGKLYAPNLTPDRDTGIGAWSADEFWGALHNGKSRDGRLLYPAFPYPNYTKVTRPDADALFAYLHSLAPQKQANRPHELRFPYNQQLTLAGWRLLYFKPGVFEEDKAKDAVWNRGAYLVEGLGHCAACHSTRNSLGATAGGLAGGLVPTSGWYAPSLSAGTEAGLGKWQAEHIVQLLKTGVSPHATVTGPMAEVVARSLQHLSDGDASAMALYLKSLPATAPPRRPEPLSGPAVEQVLALGKTLYEQHCVDCHRADGKGMPPAYPPLAGNSALTSSEPVNAIRIVLNGGFAPGTAGNPRPYSMPPYGHVLDDQQVAAVVSYVRASWGNGNGAITTATANRYRSVPLD